MKKVTRLLGMACLAGMLVFTASCKKTENTSSVNVNVPQMKVATVDGERAYINEDWEFMWRGGDEIYVYNLSDTYDESVVQVFENVNPLGTESTLATFTGNEVGARKTYGYFYFYPTNMVSGDETELWEENRQTFYVEPIQQWECFDAVNPNGTLRPLSQVDADQMPMAINTDDIHETAHLRHMFGICRITLKAKRGSEVRVTHLTVTDNAFNLWGHASVKLHEVDTLELQQVWQEYVDADPNFAADYAQHIITELGWEPAGDGGNTLEMDCTTEPEGYVVLATTPNLTAFNFMMRPLALSCGFDVDVEFVPGYGEGTNGTNILHIDRWHNANLAYSIMPGMINVWNYPTSIEGAR